MYNIEKYIREELK